MDRINCTPIQKRVGARFGQKILASLRISSMRTLWVSMFFLGIFQSVTFTVTAQNDFRQAANNDGNFGLGNPHWINSIVQQSNSKYYEGMSVPQRVILMGLTGSSHTLTLSHQSVKTSNNSHAYDFMTSWDQAYDAAGIYTSTINLLNGLPAGGCNEEPSQQNPNFLLACSTMTHTATASIPDNMEAVLGDAIAPRIAAYEAFIGSDRTIKLRANAPINSVSIQFVVDQGSIYSGTDKDANYIISWNSAATQVVFEFAGHLAIGIDPFNNQSMGYGLARGAGAISGGPYHFNLYKLDGASLGSQDNQVKGADVLALPPVECTVSGPPEVCASTNSFEMSAVVTNGGINPTYTVALTSNTANASLSSPSSGTYTGPVTLVLVPASSAGFTANGSVTVEFTVSRNGQVVTQCIWTTAIKPLPDANGQSLTQCKDPATGTATFDLTTLVSAILGPNGAGNQVTWFLDEALTIPINNPSAFTISSQTTVRARVLNPTTGCVKSAPVTLFPIDRPTCSISPETISACAGAGTQSFTAPGGMSSYQWTVTGGTILNGQGTDQINVSTPNSGTLTVSLTISSNNCSSTCSRNYTINPAATCSISGENTICSGSSTVFTASGGATYSWTGPGGFTANTASTGNISTPGEYTVTVTTAAGCSTSCSRTLTVNNVTASVIAGDQTICLGQDPAVISATTAATGSGTLSYQWQTAANCNGPWTNINGATSASYDPPASLSVTTAYRVVVTSTLNGVACAANSNCVTVTIVTLPNIVIGQDQSICTGGDPATISITSPAVLLPAYTYQWQSGTNGCSGSFTDIAGATGSSYNPPAGLTVTTSYRVVVTNGPCVQVSNCVTVTVNDLTPAVIGQNQTICSGGDPAALTITTAPSGAGPFTYQWQVSSVSCAEGWTDIAGATGTSYDPPAGATAVRYYRLHVSSPDCESFSNCVTISINNVSVQVSDPGQTVCDEGDPAPIQSVASGTGNVTYQWQRSSTGCGPNANWTNIAGATASSYDPPSGAITTYAYRVVVTSTLNGVACSANSACVLVAVNSIPPINVSATDQTVCSGGNPAAITATVTGPGTYTYQWQSAATCNGPFTDIPGATSDSYDPPAGATASTAYQVVVSQLINDVVCSAASACVMVFVNDVTASVIAADQTICSGGNPAAFTVTTAATGSGVLSYQWQSAASCNGPFTNITGATSATYDVPGGLTTTTSYRVVVTSTLNGVVCAANSNCVTVTINNVSASVIAADQSICAGGDPAAFTVTTAATGSGVLSYQWQSAASCNGPFTNITGATSATYDVPGGLTTTTSYRVMVTSTLNGVACAANSNCVTVTVNNLTPAVIAADQTICSGGDPVALTITTPPSGAGPYTYQWQTSTTGCNGPWTDISGATGNSYDPGVTTINRYYRLHVLSPDCESYSNCVTITVNNVTASVIGTNQTICSSGDPAAFTVTTAATGSGTLSYQWQSAASCNGPWTNITGATSATYDVPGGLTATTSYRVVVTSTLNGVPCAANSNCVTVTINNVSASVIGSDQSICNGGDPAAFTVTTAATGSGTLSYQWQSAANCNGPWTNITGATSATYDVPGGLSTTTSYRVMVTSTLNGVACAANSNCVTVTVNSLTPPFIRDNQTVCSGGDPLFIGITTAPVGAGPYSYQWQSSTTGCNGPWTNISGATSENYDPGVATVTTYYRLRVTSPNCEAYSNCVTITVNNVTASVVGPNRTICSGGDPAAFTVTTAATGSGTLSYQWQSAASCNGPWTNITGATSATYDVPGGLTANTSYRVVVTSTLNAVACSANSNCVTVTINNVSASVIAGNQSICAGADPAAFTVTTAATGTGTLSYQWQSATNCNGPWTNITGATSATYDAGPLSATTSYRVVVTSTLNGVACAANSNCITITIAPCSHACTYTQGAYGEPGGNHCNGDGTTSTSVQLMQRALNNAGGSYVFGSTATNRYFTLSYADATNVLIMLPGGGSSVKFGVRAGGATYGNTSSWPVVPIQPSGSTMGTIRNSLFAQTMTMFFNLYLSTTDALNNIAIVDTFITAKSSQCNFAGAVPLMGTRDTFAVPHDIVVFLANAANGYANTVEGLFKLANDVLGGVNTSVVPANVTLALDAYNRGYDKCRFLVGTLPYIGRTNTISGGISLPGRISPAAVTSANTESVQLKDSETIAVVASPNPYRDIIQFTVKSSVSGDASLELLSLTGEKTAVVYEGYFEKNSVRTFSYPVQPTKRKTIVYRFRVGNNVVSGKVLYLN